MAVPELVSVSPAAVRAYPNGTSNREARTSDKKTSRDSERRRRRSKQKNKKNKASSLAADIEGEESDAGDEEDETKENADPQKEEEKIEVEHVPEKAETEESFLEDFKRVFEKFSFGDSATGAEGDSKKDETWNATANKKADSDSDEEEQDTQLKEREVSNKKMKHQGRMKVAELKQICSRPDVVEIWDATAVDPKLLVFLKSYQNTVPVPRHWCQKRKFLPGTGCNSGLGVGTSWCLQKGGP